MTNCYFFGVETTMKDNNPEQMGIFERDSDGDYAGGQSFVDIIVIMCIVPLFGMAVSWLIGTMAIVESNREYGAYQMWIRTVSVGFVVHGLYFLFAAVLYHTPT